MKERVGDEKLIIISVAVTGINDHVRVTVDGHVANNIHDGCIAATSTVAGVVNVVNRTIAMGISAYHHFIRIKIKKKHAGHRGCLLNNTNKCPTSKN